MRTGRRCHREEVGSGSGQPCRTSETRVAGDISQTHRRWVNLRLAIDKASNNTRRLQDKGCGDIVALLSLYSHTHPHEDDARIKKPVQRRSGECVRSVHSHQWDIENSGGIKGLGSTGASEAKVEDL